MERWQKTDPLSTLEFQASEGEIEFTTDGTMVNTTEGCWREVRVGIFSKRELGPSATPDEWATRNLPRPHACIAFAALEEKDVFRRRWGAWVNRLKIADRLTKMSVLGDGVHWIWDAASLEFGKTQENLDVYHGLENLSDCGKILFDPASAEFTQWREETRRLLLEEGYDGIHGFLEKHRMAEEWAASASEDTREKKRLQARIAALASSDGYLTWHRERLEYRKRLSEGRAIGSGQVEGACKNLIGARLKQTGARWRVDRINRMGVICSLFYGDQWDAYWKNAG